ncbi:MAG TPA: TSUP family transporter [Clostridiales bacterium]|jgi:uncharacterized membrane protein YfcA|nr:TSUP family transporter [Clostridiales bacterium]
MQFSFTQAVFVCAALFLAGFIDSIAGGGGLLSLPAYYAVGLEPSLAAGTNKLSVMPGTLLATVNYARKGHVKWQKGLAVLVGFLLGMGAGKVISTVMENVLVCLLSLSAFSVQVFSKKQEQPDSRLPYLVAAIIGLSAGLYMGAKSPELWLLVPILLSVILCLNSLDLASAALLGSLLGGNVGMRLLHVIDKSIAQKVILFALPLVAAFVLFGKKTMEPKQRVQDKALLPVSLIIGLSIGVYDGLIGPGTGTFLQLLFISVLGLKALNASGTARLVNFGSGLGALMQNFSAGTILFTLALPAALFNMLGNYLGSNLAMKKGVKLIRLLLIVVLTLLMLKMASDTFPQAFSFITDIFTKGKP